MTLWLIDCPAFLGVRSKCEDTDKARVDCSSHLRHSRWCNMPGGKFKFILCIIILCFMEGTFIKILCNFGINLLEKDKRGLL